MEALAWVIGVCFAIWATFRYPKKMAILVAAVTGFAAVGVAGFFAEKWSEDREAQKRRSMVSASATFDPIACNKDFPIIVLIQNLSDADLQEVSFSFSGRAKGHSEDSFYSGILNSDQIVKPGGVGSWCWKVPDVTYGSLSIPAPEDAVWSASVMWFTLASD